jgi:hypothetical protein
MRSYRDFTAGSLIIAGFILSYVSYVSAFSGGITGRTQKNGTGCTCHGASSANAIVIIVGPDSLNIGQSATYTLSITGGPLAAAGTNVSARTGTLDTLTGSGLRKVSTDGELTHQRPKSPVSSAVTFEFRYTAPQVAGRDTVFANGNSVNLNQANSGDQWNFASNKAVVIRGNSSASQSEKTASAFRLNQNYPNPFNPSTVITYQLSVANEVKLTVFDVLGREVSTLVNARQQVGTYRLNFNAANLPSGVYLYRLQTGSLMETRKMLLVK